VIELMNNQTELAMYSSIILTTIALTEVKLDVTIKRPAEEEEAHSADAKECGADQQRSRC
jgi:hypothetical protein